MDCHIETETQVFRYRTAGIIIEDGEVLFATNSKSNYLYSIGGGVNIGETSEEAVKREVFEETGINYEVDRLAFVKENFFEMHSKGVLKKWHEVAFYYLMKPKGTKRLNSDSYSQGVKEEMVWVPINEIVNYTAHPRFFKEELPQLTDLIKHIVNVEY